MDTLVLATGNAGKIAEMRSLLAPTGIQVRAQSEFDVPEVAETGMSFVENALLKARHTARYTGLPALADDSGLCVDALRGAPGIYSARYAGAEASDENNNRKLLRKLEGLTGAARSARFHCALVLVRDAHDPVPLIFQANWAGTIGESSAGEQGFGYDPLFLPADLQCSAAQLEAAHKNRISHRGQAMAKLLQALQS